MHGLRYAMLLVTSLPWVSSGTSASAAMAAAAPAAPAARPGWQEGQEGGRGSKESGDADQKKQLAKKERELRYAQMQVEIDRLSMESERSAWEARMTQVKAKADLAKRALDNFLAERQTKESQAALRLERSQWNMEEQRQELEELRAMYAKEEFAALTKELVLKRGEMGLQFAQRQVELQAAENANEARELDRRQRSLELEVVDAEQSVLEEKAKGQKLGLEQDLKTLKGKDQLQELEEEVGELKTKLAPKEVNVQELMQELKDVLQRLEKSQGKTGDQGGVQ